MTTDAEKQHFAAAEIGRRYVRDGWGQKYINIEDAIRNSTEKYLTTCVLSAILDELNRAGPDRNRHIQAGIDRLTKELAMLRALLTRLLPQPDRQEVELRAKPVQELALTRRALNILEGNRISTFGDLVSQSPRDLLLLRGMGNATLTEIEAALVTHGLKLREG